ncbi:MAG: polysaccharide biosynthesis tyrosine autokinase [Halomonas sp.]|nr:polysaccharide biosynthesis tyrosine autokinase [Halomonas sp.]MCC5881594.1 polysaccharide biosynthesis tyrosine autokinase [Halomonas sp.]
MSKNTETPRKDDVDIGRMIGLMFDHKKLFIGIIGLFAMLGVAYVILATPIYKGDALVHVETRSSISPLGDVDNIMGMSDAQLSVNTAAEVRILRSRMVLGEVVDRMGLDVVVQPRRVPLIGDFVRRHGIQRPAILDRDVVQLDFLNDLKVPAVLKSGFSVPSFLRDRPEVWGNESITLGRFDVSDALRGKKLSLVSRGNDGYSLSLGEEWLGDGRVGELSVFRGGDIYLRVAALDAAPGAEFSLTRLTRAEAIRQLGERLQVEEVGGVRGGGTGMLELAMTGPDPEQIRRALDAVTETYLTQNVERQSAEAEKSLEFLEEQGPELRNQLAAAEDALNQYRINMDSVDLNSEAQAVINQFVELERHLSELEFKEAELAQRYTTNHPSYQSLLRQKNQLNNDREALNARVNQMPQAQQEVVRMTRDVEVTQAIYVNVLNKMQELQVARAGTVGNVRIIDTTQVAASPIQPRKLMVLGGSILLGGLLAVGIVLLRNVLNRGIESPDQIENAGMPVYATVPLSEEQQKLVRRMKHRREQHGRDVSTGLLAKQAPADTAMEAIRGLRTSLHFAMLESTNNCLMITGPSPNIGKSFIAVNLAAACAQAGQRVLVVDADMRKGHLHHSFSDKNEAGLSEMLSGTRTMDEVIRESAVPGLSFVTRGIAPPNPSELLMTASFSEFLEEASRQFDMVIIDTPPILAVTDAAVIGAQCGTSLMVARFQLNPVRELELAKGRLERAGVTVKGAIMNGMERKAAVNFGYGYYNYAYK